MPAQKGKFSKSDKKRPIGFWLDALTRAREYSLSWQNVNKLIFVQCFSEAAAALEQLSHTFESNTEVHFRRIEVACRNEDLQMIAFEYEKRSQSNKKSLTLKLASLLCGIRLLEQDLSREFNSAEIVNPSLREKGPGSFYKSSDDDTWIDSSELSDQQKFGRHIEGVYSSYASALLSSTALKTSSNAVKIKRNPMVVDDQLVFALKEMTAARACHLESDGPGPWNQRNIHACLLTSLELLKKYPNHFGLLYVCGCGAEYSGELGAAISFWQHGLKLNPQSLSTLSGLSELQQIGAIAIDNIDYTQQFESLDRFLVHGSFETHMELYLELLNKNQYHQALGSLRALVDWVHRHKGSVPAEVEALSFFGAMKAYRQAGNVPAAESCRKEAENIILSVKKHSNDPQQMFSLGKLSEEYNQLPLARICYFSILLNPDTPLELALKTSGHCVSTAPSLALKEILSSAYQIHNGHPEIRFCALLCGLSVAKIPIKNYVEKRSEGRRHVSSQQFQEAMGPLSKCLEQFEEDSEVLLMMGECLEKYNHFADASTLFASAYVIDSLNPSTALKFIGHLVRIGEFSRAKKVAAQALFIKNLTDTHKAEIHWVMATGFNTEGNSQKSEEHMSKAISFDPWSRSSLGLAMRLGAPHQSLLPQDNVTQRYDDFSCEPSGVMTLELEEAILVRARMALNAGYAEYSWTLAKILFRENPSEPRIIEFFALAASSWNGSAAIAQVMQLLTYSDRKCDVLVVAVVSTEIAAESGQWKLFRQWKEVAESCGLADSVHCSRLLFLEATSLTIGGEQMARALTLVESVIEKDSELAKESNSQTNDLLAVQCYLTVCQGEHETGREILKQWASENLTLKNLYFTLKALSRLPIRLPGSAVSTKQNLFVGGFGKNVNQDLFQDHLREFFERPVNSPLERSMAEEIHLAFGHLRQGQLARLVC